VSSTAHGSSDVQLTSSKVLADAHAMSSGDKKLTFVGDNECSKVFGMFLDLVTKNEIKLTNLIRDVGPVAQLGLFLKKWDCGATLASLILHVKFAASEGPLPVSLGFLFASLIDDGETASFFLTKPQRTWSAQSTTKTWGIEGRCQVDPRAWPLEFWEIIKDPKYIFALCQAYDSAGDAPAKLAAKFKELLALAKAG
jgi:hypothetical protein